MERQLAAIMFTDIVGYTALMDKDEEKAFALLKKNRSIQRPLIEKHQGRWLKEMGDGILASFKTVTDAVHCAVAIQQACAGEDALTLRIGLHQGEVVFDGEDVFGSGVNIASRIEALAPGGAIWVSEAIHNNVSNKTGIETSFVREETLKNVNEPVGIYELKVNQVIAEPAQEATLEEPRRNDISEEAPTTLWKKLKQRDVFRAGVVYLVVSWLLLQIGENGIRSLHLPGWLLSGFIILLITGFPAALTLAWLYERSPEGFIRTGTEKSRNNPFTAAQKKPLTGNLMIGIMILVVIVIYLSPKNADSGLDSQNGPIIKDKSVAVIPFTNLSNDPEQEYFSDGITDDILNHLSKIADLKVKSRTSVLKYKGTEMSISEIGDELGVGSILEGTVRKSGNQVRIVAQLIDVETDEHIWSETYDRELTQVFAIQSEVAMEIASVLQAKLTTSEKQNITKKATTNVTAYDYLLKARTQQFLPDGAWVEPPIDNSIHFLQEALNLDPSFALAYVQMAQLLYLKRSFGAPRRIWMDSALLLIEKGISLDPAEPEAYVLRSQIILGQSGNSLKANQDLQTAFRLDPNNPGVLRALGNDRIRKGEYEEGAAMVLKSIDLEFSRKDPEYYVEWGNIYSEIHEYDRAEDYYKQARKLSPQWITPLVSLATIYSDRGKYQEANDNLQQALELADGGENAFSFIYDNLGWNSFLAGDLDEAETSWTKLLEMEVNFVDSTQYFPSRHRLGYVKWLKGDKEEAIQLFKEQMELDLGTIEKTRNRDVWGGGHFYDLAGVNAFLGNSEEAYRWLDSTIIKNRFFNLVTVGNDPLLEPLRGDDKFQSILAKKTREEALKDDAFRKLVRELEASEQLRVELGQ